MAQQSEKRILTRTTETKVFLNYELDGVSINFTFRTDVKKELVAGKEILQRAIADIEKELAIIDAKR